MRFTRLWPLVVVLGLVGCPPVAVDPPEDSWRPTPVGEESCPKKWGSWDDRGVETFVVSGDQRLTELSGPAGYQDIPEFHDCQRFVLEGRENGRDTLSTGVYTIFSARRPTPIGERLPDRGSLHEESGELGLAEPAAQIFATEPYPPLGLGAGLNCVYIYKTRDGDWGGGVRHDGARDLGCHHPIGIRTVQDFTRLRVVQESVEGLDSYAYPPVARWKMHHGQNGYEYRMGVPCDWGWCEVFPIGSDEVPSNSHAEGVEYDDTDPDQRRIHRVKGWYDEQVLTERVAGGIRPAGILGTVFPHPRLGLLELDDFRGTWVRTASVALTPFAHYLEGNPYREKLNFELTHESEGLLNQIALCNGTWLDCRPSPDVPEPRFCESDDTSGWWARLTSWDGNVVYRCVSRCPYDVIIPGTVRWSWKSNDEGIWMRCVNGCCEVGVEDDE